MTRPCPSCGYDLTGNTTGACPECGAVSVLARYGVIVPADEGASCAGCGYELGGLPEGGACPECGLAVRTSLSPREVLAGHTPARVARVFAIVSLVSWCAPPVGVFAGVMGILLGLAALRMHRGAVGGRREGRVVVAALDAIRIGAVGTMASVVVLLLLL